MILVIMLHQADLSVPPPASAITAATDWVSNVLFGPLANIIAVIAIAWIGFAMLSGRVDIRRGLSVVLGCFLLFGAKGIAGGLRSTATAEAVPSIVSVPPPPSYVQSPSSTNNANGYDPYAGAAVMRPGQ
jgi:type IV secretory pathway VirB2 component (pilin)